MTDRNSPITDQLRVAGKNAGNEGRDYWEWLMPQAADEIERLRAALEAAEEGLTAAYLAGAHDKQREPEA